MVHFIYQIFISEILITRISFFFFCIAYIYIYIFAAILIITVLNVSRGILTALQSTFVNLMPKSFSGWSMLVSFFQRSGQILLFLFMLNKFGLHSRHCKLLCCRNSGFSFIPLKNVDIFILAEN